MEMYVVTDEDNLYGDRVGNAVWETYRSILLDLGNEQVVFDKTEVTRIL